jgi:hypothetical protein
MITQENFKAVLDDLTLEQLKEYWESQYDMVLVILSQTNSGYSTTLKFATFSDDWDEYLNNGNICCDKDEFASYLHYYEPKNWLEFYNNKD